MALTSAKATSVLADGEPDGFEIPTAWFLQRGPQGATRLVVSGPPEVLRQAFPALIEAMSGTVQVLYRQIVNRQDPKPQGSPSRDFAGLDVPANDVLAAVDACANVVYHDARGELWVRDSAGAQVVLDCDGMLYAYPDDVAFRDALDGLSLPEREVQTVAQRDYVRHWFHAAADLDEDALITRLHLTEVAPQARTGGLY